MTAIPVKHTEVDTESAWDNSKVEAETKSELRYVHAWVDGTADPELKGSYKFPHHYEDGGPAILAGVNNAKSRLSQADIPQADVDGVTAHLNAHQKDAKQGIIKTLQAIFEGIKTWLGGDAEPVEQAISMPDVYMAVAYALDAENAQYNNEGVLCGPYRRLIDCYLDGQDVYAVVAFEGKIYKVPVTIIPGGVTLGEMTQVEIVHNPVGQSFRVLQQANGQYRWFAFPAATAVLNRNGVLNARALYDNFVQHIADGEPMPYLSFYHAGSAVNLGQADFVERDGYSLLVSGLFNQTPLAQCLARSDSYDGVSIGYYRNPEAMQMLEVAEGIKIPVDTDGTLLEISAMHKEDAACLMTVFAKGVTQMNQETLKKLKTLAGDDPAALAQVESLANQVDQINQTIAGDPNLVTQEQDVPEPQADTTPVVDPPAVPQEPAGETPREFTLTEEAMQAIAEQVRSGFAELVTSLQQSVQVAQEEWQTFRGTTLPEIVAGLQSRLDALEQTDQAKVRQAMADMPRNVVTVGYQPRTRATPPEEADPADIASESLANLKAALRRN